MPQPSLKAPVLGDVLRKWRERSGLNVREAADVIGISYSTLSRLENADSAPDARTFMAILNWLVKGSDANKSTET